MKIHPTSTKSSGLFGLSSRTITAFSMSVEPRCRLWQVRSKRERAKPTFFGPSWGHGWFYDVLPSGYLTVCHGKWPIYRWFTWVYLLKLVIMAMLVITRWYMFPKFGGNMCIDAKVADDTQEKNIALCANLNALQVCSTEILVAPISRGQSSLSRNETCNLEGAAHC